jgi:hypothetical protein
MRLDAVAPNMKDTTDAIVEILTADGYAGFPELNPSGISYPDFGSPEGSNSRRDKTPSRRRTPSGPPSSATRYNLRSASKAKRRLPVSSDNGAIDEVGQVSDDGGARKTKKRIVGACFLAHSLGTTVVSWMLHNKSCRRLVASTVLIDPVTFMLIMPQVCASYVHPDPKNVATYVSSFVLAKELFIANALSRHFNWSYNAMFLEDLVGAWEEEFFEGKKKTGYFVRKPGPKKMRNTVRWICTAFLTMKMIRFKFCRLYFPSMIT